MNVNQVINHCLELDLYPLQNYAGKNFNIVYDYIKNNTNQNPNRLLIPSIFTCIASNGKFSEGEWDFVAHFIGNYSYQQALDTAGEFYCAEAQEVTRQFANMLPYDVREAFVCMCIAVLCVDKRVDGAEVEFLRTLL